VLYNLVVIGEAATQISEETRGRAAEIPWTQIGLSTKATRIRCERGRCANRGSWHPRPGVNGGTEGDRRAFAVPAQAGFFRDLDLGLLDPEDPDDRRLLIEAEHPELADAIERGEEVVVIDGVEVNPRLHVSLHEIPVQQLLNDDPPEVWGTAKRLIAAGYERHEILHMLASALAPQLWRVMAEHETFSRDGYVAALGALP